MIVATFVTAFADRLTHIVTVDSTAGFSPGDAVSVMLDNGEPYYPIVVAVGSQQLVVSPVLPWTVGGTFGDPIQNTIVDLGPTNLAPFLVVDPLDRPLVDDLGDWFSASV
jgi:hypothetical protein